MSRISLNHHPQSENASAETPQNGIAETPAGAENFAMKVALVISTGFSTAC
jgi:hypothetical protein